MHIAHDIIELERPEPSGGVTTKSSGLVDTSFSYFNAEGRHSSFAYFQGSLPMLLRGELSTSDEILFLHSLATHDAQNELPDAVGYKHMIDRYLNDRPDAVEKLQALQDALPNIPPERADDLLIPLLRYDRLRAMLYTMCLEDTIVDPFLQTSGQVRSLGKRIIADNQVETVYGSVRVSLDHPNHPFVFFGRNAYYTLSKDLGKVFGKLSTAYERASADADSIEDRMVADGYLNLIGSRLLQPFWDGNRRAYTLHTALTLERQGLSIRNYATLKEIAIETDAIGREFLEQFMHDYDIPELHGSSLLALEYELVAREKYMDHLHKSILDVIEQGVSGRYSELYQRFADTMMKIMHVGKGILVT